MTCITCAQETIGSGLWNKSNPPIIDAADCGPNASATRLSQLFKSSRFVFLLGVAIVLHAAAAIGQTTKADDSVLRTSPLDADGITATRNNMISFIWGSGGFPSSKQPSLHQAVPSPIGGLTNLQSVDGVKIAMDFGEYTLGYHFIPLSNKKNRLVVLHHGHACELDDGPDTGSATDYGIRRTVNALLSNGFGVMLLSMPRKSPANASLGVPENCGDHSALFSLRLPTGNALKFFLEPVVVSINYLSTTSAVRYSNFNMMGLSGGGWTTVMAAAVDPRIKLSFPVAGTIPMYLRAEPYQSHDLEQYLSAFYGALSPPTAGVAGYLDLYLLGARGTGRGQVQILNRHDDCCFGEPEHNTWALGIAFESAIRVYETRLKTMATGASGFFRTYIDEVAPSHQISDDALQNVILPILGNSAKAKTITTTIRSVFGGNLCLDVPNFGRPPANGDRIQIFSCNGGLNQEWSFQGDGTVRSQFGSGGCLDVPDFGRPPVNGDRLQFFTCHGGTNQQFDLGSDRTLRTRRGGLCVDVPVLGRAARNNDPVQVFHCNGGSNQVFSANKLTTALGSLWSTALCVDIPDFGRPPANGDFVQVFECNGGANQRFNLQSDGTIRTERSALCLDVPNIGRPPQNGDRLQVFACNGGTNQKFDVLGDGSIKSRTTGGLCVDIPNFGRAPQNGDRLQVFGCTGGVNQRFAVAQ